MKLNIFNKVEMIEICPHCRSTPKKLTLLLGAWLLLFHCRTLIWLAISYVYTYYGSKKGSCSQAVLNRRMRIV